MNQKKIIFRSCISLAAERNPTRGKTERKFLSTAKKGMRRHLDILLIEPVG
jgi:hypothetical protein